MRPALLFLFALLLTGLTLAIGCKGGTFKQNKGSLTGSSDQRSPASFSSGTVHFTLKKDYKDTGDNKITVNLRDNQGSVVKELFHTGDQGSFTSVAEIETPGSFTIEISQAKGQYTVSWE